VTKVETVFLDFDGTLAHREGGWTNTLVKLIREAGHDTDAQTLRPHLRNGFPWHRYELGHSRSLNGLSWWGATLESLERTLVLAGVPEAVARSVRSGFREHYLDISAFSIYPDTVPALNRLRDFRLKCVIASNHTPELPAIVEQLGLAPYFDGMCVSALVGYDKPHGDFFRAAFDGVGSDAGSSVMIGDSFINDVTGARAVGMRAIHVRAPAEHHYRWYAETLTDAVEMLAEIAR
jgi:putative hydrolase of the HAD superfamily